MKIFQFKNGESLELKGDANLKELSKELAQYGLKAKAFENGKGKITMGVYEYPFVLKRYREVWISAMTDTGYAYLQVLTNNPYPGWLNDAYGHKVPTEKAEIYLNGASFKVRDMAFSMGSHSTYVLYPSYEDLRMEHFENKLVSIMTFQGEAQTREFDEQTDKAHVTALLKKLHFEPKLWVIRKKLSGKIEIPSFK
ncbi:MAG TPA: hypothetical protein VNJ08_06345 [Bacteriovoracaceae bacterium]|nr:hypothetical protein [Bacteriovoracaceae bacterium]